MKKNKPDWIFECGKCSHELYVDKKNVGALQETECPQCGEESERLWIFVGEGDFDNR